MKAAVLIFMSCLAMSGVANAGTKMSVVMARCEDYTSTFDRYAECIKTTYSSEGNEPNGEAVRAFYSHLDEIGERYAQGSLTESRAKVETHNAYRISVEAYNKELARELINQKPILIYRIN